MAEILSLLLAKNPEVRVVVNAITLESVSKVMEWTAPAGSRPISFWCQFHGRRRRAGST